YRRLEARGDIRGGRFVAGFAGEQFALPEAVGKLREVRREQPNGQSVSLSGADPLNLTGILTPGARLPSLAGNRLLYEDGVPIALLAAGEVQFLAEFDAGTQWEHQKALLRGPSLVTSHAGRSRQEALLISRALPVSVNFAVNPGDAHGQ
ncbi:MAG: hypothetical protein L0Y50_09090, partial [Beijerinckiaceae bacterium]|nr:hypothetical protein [Beijerinckiaceae bacterium]